MRCVFCEIVTMMSIASFLYGEEYFKIAFASIGYVGMLPTYINVLSVYAIC